MSLGKGIAIQPGSNVPGARVSHIFRGISPHHFNPNASPQANLHAMRADLLRLNIRIDPSAVIANSTLKELMAQVNHILSPTPELPEELQQMLGIIMHGAKFDAQGESLAEEMRSIEEHRDFNISIGAGTLIGERVNIGSSTWIGSNTIIEDNVDILGNVRIGDHCFIGAGAYLNWNCSIGDHAAVVRYATFKRDTVVPSHAWVVHEHEDSYVARIVE